MKKTINQKQLENMIVECFGQVLAESRQPRQQKPARKVMNEAQFQNYIQGIINEELEQEGLWGKLTGGAKGIGKAISGEFGKAKRGIMQNGLNNEYNGQKFGDRMKAAVQTIRDNAKMGDKRQDLAGLQKQVASIAQNPLVQSHKQWSAIAQQLLTSIQASSNAQGTPVSKNFKKNYGA